LHKEAYNVKDGSISLNEQAKHLLFFTSTKVVPILRRLFTQASFLASIDSCPTFIDPNISSIQIDRSFADSTFLSPQSPNLMCRPRRRINRNHTPQRLDEGVGIYQDSPDDRNVNDNHLLIIAPLFVTSCKLFTEWSAITCCSETANFITQAIIEWCPILLNGLRSECESIDIYDEIIPVFFRLSMQVVLTSEKSILLKEILLKINSRDESRSVDALCKVLSTVLLSKANLPVLQEVVSSFLDVTYDALPDEIEGLHFKLPESFNDEWLLSNQSLSVVLLTILTNPRSCNVLVNHLLERILVHSADVSSRYLVLFDLQCLWIIVNDANNCKISTKVKGMINQTIQRLDFTAFDERLQRIVEEFNSRIYS
jgi:hypothetical protein